MQNLGDRIKRYENVSHHSLTPKVPVIIRVDGRAFHTFTRNMEKPFSTRLMRCMVLAAQDVAKEMQGFKAAYIQSDEVTFLLTDYEDVQTQGWFGYDLAKVVSTSAALMTAYFLKHFGKNDKISTFDSRAFNVPKSDVVNTFLWRAKDWERNSLQMYARAHFSHKELHGKNKQQMHNMLHEKGLNWTIDLGNRERNGTFILNDEDKSMLIDSSILPTYNSIADNIDFLI